MGRNQTLCFGEVHRFLGGLFDGDLHAKRILSLTNATLGVIKTASLAFNTIGQGLALARGLSAASILIRLPLMADTVEKLQKLIATKNRSNDILSEHQSPMPPQ